MSIPQSATQARVRPALSGALRAMALLAILTAAVSIVGIVQGADTDDLVDVRDAARAMTWILAGGTALLWASSATFIPVERRARVVDRRVIEERRSQPDRRLEVEDPRARIDTRTRAGRILLGLAFLSYGIGEAGGVFLVADQGSVPAWSWADAPWLVFYPLMAGAIVLLAWSPRLSALPRLRIGLDAVLVTLGTLSAWALALEALGVTRLASVDSNALYGVLAYLAGDVALLGLIAALANSNRWSLPAMGTWLSAILVTLALADVAYWLVDGADAASWWWLVDLAYLLPPLVLVAAIVANGGPHSRRGNLSRALANAQRAPGSDALLPLLAATCALAVLLVVALRGAEPVVSGLALVAVSAVVLRLWIAYQDSRSLAFSRVEARTDDLTGLPNRRAVLSGVWPDGEDPAEPTRSGRAVLILELNRVLEIEDAVGQEAGDQLLLEVARRLREAVQVPVRLARLDGDKFAVVAANVDEVDVAPVAVGLLSILDEPLTIGDLSVHLTATMGAAWAPHPGPGHRELYRRADIAKNVAMRQRSRLVVFDPAMDDAAERLRLIVQFERALDDSTGLALHYQPIIDLHTGNGVGVEALLRWTSPDGTSVPPGVILPLVHAAGLTQRLSSWVLNEAFEQAAAWRRQGLDIPVSVNVDAESVTSGLAPQVASLLAVHGLPAWSVTVELLEDSALGDDPAVRASLADLRLLGVHLAIDDFGTGWSGLSYLQTLQVDTIKIDRSFVRALPTEAPTYAIVSAIMDMAERLAVTVVAEGIETETERATLRQLGCHRGQGFGIGMPMQQDELVRWWCQSVSTPSTTAAG